MTSCWSLLIILQKNIVIDTIVSGSAIVADRLVEVYAKVYGVPFLCKTNYHNFAKT